MKSDYAKGRGVSRPFFLWRSKGRKPTGPDTTRTYAYKIDYVNHHTPFNVEKLILVGAPPSNSRLGKSLAHLGQKQL